MIKITIGLTTFDRPEVLDKMRTSLLLSRGLDDCNLRIYDDCSTAYDKEYLQRQFPEAAEIVRRDRNLGSDFNIHQMFVDFLKTDDDVLVAIDSDLIFHPDWIAFMREALGRTGPDAVLSLYNSALHPPVKQVVIDSVEFLEKGHIGSAAAVFRRDVLKEIVEHVPASRRYDWDWSEYLFKRKIPILVPKRSYVQHIGIHGTNNCPLYCEYGLNFSPGNEMNEKILIDFFIDLVSSKDSYVAERLAEQERAFLNRLAEQERAFLNRLAEAERGIFNSYSFRLGHLILSPARCFRDLFWETGRRRARRGGP